MILIRLKHVVKLAESLFDSGAHLVVLERFHCSLRSDVLPVGVDFTSILYLSRKPCKSGKGRT
jgi:hypothetical protein